MFRDESPNISSLVRVLSPAAVWFRCAHFWKNYLFLFMQMLCLCWRRSTRAEGQPALLHRQLPSEVRMSDAARPLRTPGATPEKMLGGGRRGRRNIMSHTSMPITSDGYATSVACTNKSRLLWSSSLLCSLSVLCFKIMLSNKYTVLQLWPVLDRTCINVLQAAD